MGVMNLSLLMRKRARRSASCDDLRRAAAAVVDAALRCKLGCEAGSFPEALRRELIEAVYLDPSITKRLFVPQDPKLH